jgi:hypothetical protein
MEIDVFTFKTKTLASSSALLYYIIKSLSGRQNLLFQRRKVRFQRRNVIFTIISYITCPILQLNTYPVL